MRTCERVARRCGLAALIVLSGAVFGCAHFSLPGPEEGRMEASMRNAEVSQPSPFVSARGRELILEGRPFRFVGVNVYSLASSPVEGKFMCGRRFTDEQVDELFREVREMGGTAVRFWAFQAFAEGGRDFSRLDKVVELAKRRGLKLIFVLENQWSDCTGGGYKFASWYRGGYRKPYGGYPLSFPEYVERVVVRYRGEPAVMMWQIMNEAESRNPYVTTDPEALYAFARGISLLIKSVDRNHLVSLGTMGWKQPGTRGPWYERLHAIRTIDVVEAHDNRSEELVVKAVAACAATGARLNKPCFIGEMGLPARNADERVRRSALMYRKLVAVWSEGVAGILIWSYRAGDGMDMDFDRNDPLFASIRSFVSRYVK